MGIQIRNVSKSFGHFHALKDVTLTIPYGELVALLGPSGGGKTTLLRIIAGLDTPDSGSVILHGQDVSAKNPKDRDVGFVFQHYALFQHLTVFENIAFGLTVRPRRSRPSKEQIREKVTALIRLVQLENFIDRYPCQLSGGQRQRVALARALAVEPKILLLDEPFGALDAKVRKELRRWLRRLHEEVHVTTIFVTHDQEEAMEVANQLVIINEGRLEQAGTPEEIYHQPANPFVFHFIGDVNSFNWPGLEEKETVKSSGASAGPHLRRISVRPHLLKLSLDPPEGNRLAGRILHIIPAGPYVKVELKTEWGDSIQASISQERYKHLDLKTGMEVFIIPEELQDFEGSDAG
ncbi:MAG: sulfate ABC transporter ATP-binding protein [Deltaproteobacteria bacterium]|nr:sulfate ABC transporter ATP-binding protein [Deltaproteobacteria bacterium]